MDAESQFAANMTFLKAHPTHHAMYEQIHACPLTNLKFLPTPSGYLYGEVFDYRTQEYSALCHPEDPVQQARVSCDQFYTPQARVFCMIGLGLGYNAVEFAKRLLPHQRLCIWDVDAQLFKAMLYAVDITPLFTMPNVNLLVGQDCHTKVEEWWLSLHAHEKLAIQMPLREGYTGTYLKDAYEVLMTKTMDMLRFQMVGISTWRLFGRHIGDNDLENIPEYFAHPGYEHLAGLWKDHPAVCLAAGPSLQKNLACLLPQDIRSRIALLAAGTVFALVQGLGLAPDVVTTIDFQRLNWTDQFRAIPLDPECPLVYLHSTYPQTVRRWPGPRFVAENASDTVAWLRRYSQGKASAAEVQTVAHLNIKVALMLGANPIILLGQDLSMPLDAHHAAGARAQDQAPNETPPEAWVTAMDYQGQPVQTRHSFLSMLTVFERLIAENPQTTFLNCSEAGLPIKGAVNLPLAEALQTCRSASIPPPLRPAIAAVFQAYVPQMPEALPSDLQLLRQQVQDLGRFAQEMQALEVQRVAVDRHAFSLDQWAALQSAEVQTVLEAVEDLQQGYDQQICAYEARILGERPVAWSLFAIRRFDFIEFLAEAPPPPEAIATPLAQDRYNAARMLRIATMIDEAVVEVQQVLRHAMTRLGRRDPEALLRRWQRWHYARPRTYNENGGTTVAMQHRLLAQQLFHTQQYAACLALLTGAPRKAARIRRHLVQFQVDLREALPAYFQTRQTITLGRTAPGTSDYY
jgi:hypothetical protein